MPRRHRKGEGSLRYRKDLGMYEIRLTIGGKRKSFYSPGPRTRENEKRADLLRRKLALAYGITPNNPDNPPTLLEWLEAHAEAARAEGRRPNTLNSYARHIRLIAQHLGDPRLDTVTAERLEALFRALAQEGYSRSTVAQVRNLLHAAFERAVRYADPAP
jgi:integrase